MNHAHAIRIFEEIRARPYRVFEAPGVPVNNCYFKGIELLQRLGTLGYTIRGRIGRMAWDMKIIPAEILALAPAQFPATHFYVEAEIDGKWRTLDSSFQPNLARHGFRIGDWKNNKTCVEITKLYSLEESIAYQKMWQDPDYAAEYFAKSGLFLRRLNAWFATLD